MALNMTNASLEVLLKDEALKDESQVIKDLKEKPKFIRQIIWRNVIALSYLHLGALYGVYLSFTSAKFMTILFGEYSLI